MNRQASIHITESKLYQLIKEYLFDYENDDPHSEEYAEQQAMEMVEHIMIKGKPFSLDKRLITISNDKVLKEVRKKASNDKMPFLELAQLIVTVRKGMKHRGVKKIDMNSAEYNTLKKLADVINEFADDWDMSYREAAIYYLKAGLSKISSYRNYIGKLCDMSESISLEYEAMDIIRQDNDKSLTRKIHDIYIQKINEKTGMAQPYLDKPTKYIAFIEVKEICKKYNVEPSVFISAQFDGLAWTDTFPEPNQLVSEKAIERLNKYLYTKKIKLGKPDRVKADTNLTNILKRIKDGEN